MQVVEPDERVHRAFLFGPDQRFWPQFHRMVELTQTLHEMNLQHK